MANLTISEQAYQTIQQPASEHGQTPEAFIEAWTEQQAKKHDSGRDPYTDPRYQTFDEFFQDLGMTDEEIADSNASSVTVQMNAWAAPEISQIRSALP